MEKTRDLLPILKKINKDMDRTLFVLTERYYSDFENYRKEHDLSLKGINKHQEQNIRRRLTKGLRRASRNIPYVHTISYKNLNAHELFYHNNIIFLEEAALKLDDLYKE